MLPRPRSTPGLIGNGPGPHRRWAGSKLRSPALQAAMERARQQAGPTRVTTGHVLNAILADPPTARPPEPWLL